MVEGGLTRQTTSPRRPRALVAGRKQRGRQKAVAPVTQLQLSTPDLLGLSAMTMHA
jgi:hypothetical protein